ncbi:hypothetical protein CWB89_18080 [Pseudoalteromonas piscicida]|uniref:FAD-binding oxidoreductase n=1 Tax=Pseudoalteromonas piscicida TaxID=43662 RepID=A0AAQ2EV24_PSEO7|nr:MULTISPECIES: hypothetical protein [Pseudoalteromonas]ATD06923.1 hypothetical protein PPIS_a1855 [Pseudoalteromonas piscicida]KJY88241.1 hypothetical protein TW75_12640 [Pseudoalteromonas piscicida]TMN33676.1 hypothetical protein CWB95_22485 [Pseudoalteromonas piscicida]TMN39753.1 hypothetical protein CWB94_10610 [Pseudoalteromonas piscicida]TMN53459.1 hypothetical protein CWB93_14750 [Pseudoalteromonas piscicida]
MIKKRVIIFSLLFASSHGSADELKPFTSDGCSAFPDGTLAQNELWLSCCTAHDLAYWKGGTAIERENADIALQKCVAAVGQEEVATLMLAGVRLGGLPYLPTPFRWGYGWSYPRRYAELTAEEIEQVNKHMAKLALDKK